MELSKITTSSRPALVTQTQSCWCFLYYQGKKDQEVAPIVGVGLQTGHNIRKRLVQ